MPGIKILVTGKTRAPFLQEGEAYYLKKLKRYAPVEWVEARPARIVKGRTEKEILNLEGQALREKISPRDRTIALHREGHALSSEELAGWLEREYPLAGRLCFVVGGPLGFSTTFLDGAHQILSLSRLTLTHEMSRLLLLEQLYRGFTILKGEQYHKAS